MDKQAIIEQFEKHANAATYHFADDGGSEWKLADQNIMQAKQIYNTFTELQPQFDEIMVGQLWSIKLN